MALLDDFTYAQETVRQLKRTPSRQELLQLYGLYKQASQGDVQGDRPGLFDLKGRAKYDAWAAQAGKPRDSAMQAYVDLAARLGALYGNC